MMNPRSKALRWIATGRLCLQHKRQSRKPEIPRQSQGTSRIQDSQKIWAVPTQQQIEFFGD
jgi:hypothetical protein